MKIVILDGRTLAPDRAAWAGLEEFGEVVYHDVSTAEQVVERAAGATVVATNKTPIREETLARLPELRLITLLATGYDCVDVKAARARGVTVCNVPVYGTRSVSQFVFALLLELCHHAGLHDEAVHDGEWTNQPDFSLRKTRQVELAGKTMGIVGYGRIGRQTAVLARAFGMDVLTHSRSGGDNSPAEGVRFCGLDELFAGSDVISLHCPMTEQTAGLINRDQLSRVKPGAFLINTARGGLVVEEDLAEALNSGRLGAAALDVVSKEPIRPDNPLLKAKNCLITPHIAWATDEARGRLMETTVANVAAFLGGKPINVVN
ncbi:Glycerate dehydrogenase [Aquisphaera giovannonii]|uniref:Glycerate dehydrogenase n=1 Tax=Aquisphaera giovannonii TaxID=406548 RepID=A0A5B9WD40_9BACT|nr:D-2-hydroxyacid dehydrogenase [Aquisphaera giovannonii]QEH38194.1 Glycerate dehydrogenase [Aquisphaera giovannonii]